MRILYVTATLPFGAKEPFILPEIAALLRRGHDVRVIPIRPRGRVVHTDAEDLVMRTIAAPLVSGRVLAGATRAMVGSGVATAGIASVLARRGTLKTRLKNACVLPKALWLANVVEELAPDHVHAHWASTSATAAMVAASLADVPWSLTAHRWDIAEGNLLAEKAASAAFVRAISADGARDLRARLGEHGRLVELHMGVALPAQPAPSRGRREGFRILVPAGLDLVKGHAVLFRALALPGPTSFGMEAVLAGDGPLRRDLERLAVDLGIHDRVLFLGQLPHDEVLRLLASGEYDLVAMTSTPIDGAKEGIPVSLMESMAHSIPVLATNLGGISELVGEGAGVLVPPGDEHVLAEALCHLAANPAVRASLAIAGRRRVEEEFSVDVVAARLETLFEDAARRSK